MKACTMGFYKFDWVRIFDTLVSRVSNSTPPLVLSICDVFSMISKSMYCGNCSPFAKVIIQIFSQNSSEYPTHRFHFLSCVLKNASPSNGRHLFSNGYPNSFERMTIFFERIPQAVQTDTRSVRKRQTVTYVTWRITDLSTRVASDEMVLGWKLC